MQRVLMLAIAMVAVLSCSKSKVVDDDDDTGNPNDTTAIFTQGCLLTSYEQQGAFATHFTYNSSNRLVSFREGSHSIDSLIYNAQGKVSEIRTYYQGGLYYVANLTYNSSGELVQMVSYEYGGGVVVDSSITTQTYQGGFLHRVESESGGDRYVDYYDFLSDGNIERYASYEIVSGTEELRYERFYTYSSLPNPFRSLSDMTFDVFSNNAVAKDSLVNYDQTTGFTSSVVYTYAYTTNADGWPEQSVRTDQQGFTDVENYTYDCP